MKKREIENMIFKIKNNFYETKMVNLFLKCFLNN